MTENRKGDAAVRQQLDRAVARGALKASARENILRWLQPSFAEAVIEAEAVGDTITGLIERERWDELNDAFFQINALWGKTDVSLCKNTFFGKKIDCF